MSQTSRGELVVKSVATAVVATAIVEAGISLSKAVAKQPLVLFSLGIMSGYLTHKYRKEILAISSHTAKQSKEFIVQQKQHIDEMLDEIKQSQD